MKNIHTSEKPLYFMYTYIAQLNSSYTTQ